MIIPSIDIMGGRAVQLRQGRELLLTDPRDPVELAGLFGRFGPVAIVDLDAAMGQGSNAGIVEACCREAPCRVGGGIRTEEDVRSWIKRGADRVVVGTRATPEFLSQFPREWMIAAVDAYAGEVVTHGWKTHSGRNAIEVAREVAPHCSELLFTQVDREGTLEGVPLEAPREMAAAVDVPITLAGGVSGSADVKQIVEAGFAVQVGRSLYEGHLDLRDAWIDVVRFDDAGLVPTIVQDVRSRSVLMMAFSNRESLSVALGEGVGAYYSRSRASLWRKGEKSGHTQRLVRARYDCDRDCLLFQVEQNGPACHTRRADCFGAAAVDVLVSLSATMESRKASGDGYTGKLLGNADLRAAKLREESQELIEASEPNHVAWEAADLIYHALADLSAKGVSVDRVLSELRGRFAG